MFINIRGTNGSGKTTIIKKFLRECSNKGLEIKEHKAPINHISIKGKGKNIVVIGKYLKVECGGADTISYKGAHEDIQQFILDRYAESDIVIEGMAVSNAYNRYNKIARHIKNAGKGSLIIYLGTPLKECIRNVNKRRLSASKAPLSSVENVRKTYINLQNSFHKTVKTNHTILVSSEAAKHIVCSLLKDL